jgi:hypothetical protein
MLLLRATLYKLVVLWEPPRLPQFPNDRNVYGLAFTIS